MTLMGSQSLETISRWSDSTSVQASVHNHFNQDRQRNRRQTFKQNRAAALAEWRQLAA